MTTIDLQARALKRNRTERNSMRIKKCECVSRTRRGGRDRSKGTHWTGILTGVEVEDVLNLRTKLKKEAKHERGQNIGWG
jgi:hypothetical protein